MKLNWLICILIVIGFVQCQVRSTENKNDCSCILRIDTTSSDSILILKIKECIPGLDSVQLVELFQNCPRINKIGSIINNRAIAIHRPVDIEQFCKERLIGYFKYINRGESNDYLHYDNDKVDYIVNGRVAASYKLTWTDECRYSSTVSESINRLIKLGSKATTTVSFLSDTLILTTYQNGEKYNSYLMKQ